MAKGSSFEREICKLLSDWWSYGKRDDIFWRTAGSGAMAKTRSKSNKKTFGQYGDIQATDPIGQKLIDMVSIEIKRGYSKNTFADVVDKMDNAAEQQFEKFVIQAETDAVNANTHSWFLIVKRDRRQTMVFMPFEFSRELKKAGSRIGNKCSVVMFSMKSKHNNKVYKVFGMTLESFLSQTTPKHIKKIWDDLQHYRPPEKLSEKKKKQLQDDYNSKYDQILKCTNCDMNEVRWTGKVWVCRNCTTINDYHIL